MCAPGWNHSWGSWLGMRYQVQVVGDAEMPEGMDRLIVEREDGTAVLLLSGVYAECWRFMRAYEDTREPCDVPSVLLPARPLRIAV